MTCASTQLACNSKSDMIRHLSLRHQVSNVNNAQTVMCVERRYLHAWAFEEPRLQVVCIAVVQRLHADIKPLKCNTPDVVQCNRQLQLAEFAQYNSQHITKHARCPHHDMWTPSKLLTSGTVLEDETGQHEIMARDLECVLATLSIHIQHRTKKQKHRRACRTSMGSAKSYTQSLCSLICLFMM